MELKDFFITATVEGNNGTVKGSTSKTGRIYNYDKALNDLSLEELFVHSSHCLGSQNTTFKRGNQAKFRLQYEPGPGTQQGDKYTLKVKVERKGSCPHTEEKSIELIAPATKQRGKPKDGTTAPDVDPNKFELELDEDKSPGYILVKVTPGSKGMELKDFFITAAVEGNRGTVKGTTRKKESGEYDYGKALNDLSLEELFVAFSKCLGSQNTTFKRGNQAKFRLQYEPGPGTQQGDKYTLKVKVERKGSCPHTEEKSIELIAPATTQLNQPEDDTTDAAIAPDKFGLKLDEKLRRSDHRHNFVLLTVTPGSRGMELKDFFITAAVEGNQGTLKGAGSKSGSSFKYDKALNDLSLEELFVASSKCLGSQDTTFRQKEAATFWLRYTPGPGTQQGDAYTLKVKVERKGSSPHTEEQSIELIAPPNLGTSKVARKSRTLQ